jgi:CHASE2 domain-containing sensor protein
MPSRTFVEKLSRVREVCAKKGSRYWVCAVLFAILGGVASHKLDGVAFWLKIKYKSYLLIQNARGGQNRLPQTTLVAIGDEEYYGPELAARKPLRRDYLAKLVTRIAEARPSLIALDVDLRSPNPESPQSDFAAYAEENAALFKAICGAAEKTKIVLSKAVSVGPDGRLRADRNIYDGNTECAIPGQDVSVGYLTLPRDLRRVPMSVEVYDGTLVDSLALSAARALRHRQYPESVDVENIPYGEFHRVSDFARVNATQVMNTTARDKLRDQIVLVFGAWHVLAKNRGASIVDTFQTPVGPAGGAYVHANLLETLLAASQREAPSEWSSIAVEGLTAAFLAIAFAFPIGLLKKFGWILAVAAILTLSAWLFLQVFAVFFDILPVLASMGLHATADQVEEWRTTAAEHSSGHVPDTKPEGVNA